MLFLLSSLQIGGSERKTVNIVNNLIKKGINCHLLYLNPPHTLRSLVAKDVQLYCLERKRKVDFNCFKKYRNYISEKKIKTVCCVNLYPLFVHSLALSGMQDKPRMFVTINTSVIKSLKGRLHMLIYAPLLRRGCQIIFGSSFQKKLWISKYHINPLVGKVIYNGIDLNYFNPEESSLNREEMRRRLGIKENEIVIGMVARFVPWKAHTDLLKATRKIIDRGIDIKILFLGEGTEREKIIGLIKSLEMENNVIILENTLDVRPVLVSMDIFALTSIAVETFPNAALEVMAMSKPVILSNIGGTSEMVENGINGFLYPPGDIDALASRIQTIIDNDLFLEMGKEARKIIEDKFTLEKMVSEYEKCLILY